MKWEKVGVIGVDAGICWLGDPCYILHTEKPPKAIGKDWGDFCDKIDHENKITQFNYDIGHDGLGIVVSTGYGDGEYDVEVLRDRHTIHGVRIMFTNAKG